MDEHEQNTTPEPEPEVHPSENDISTEDLKKMLEDLKTQQNELIKELQARHAEPEGTPKPAAADWTALFGNYMPR